MSDKGKPQGRVRLWINSYLGGMVVAVTALLSAFIATPVDNIAKFPSWIQAMHGSPITLVFLFVAALASAVFPWALQRPNYATLAKLAEKSTAKGLSLERALKRSLAGLAQQILLDTEESRITVYYEYDGNFYSLARHSKNRVFSQKGRDSYPCDKGVIGHIWDNHAQIVRLPLDESKWLSETTTRWGFTREAALGLSMKARCIAGILLQHDQDWVGLVVIETLKPNGIKQTDLEEAKKSWAFEQLQDLVGSAGSNFNNFDDSKKLGKPITANAAFDLSGEWEAAR